MTSLGRVTLISNYSHEIAESHEVFLKMEVGA